MRPCKYTDGEVTCPLYSSEKPNDQSLINEGYRYYVCSNEVVAKECDVYPLLEFKERVLALEKKIEGLLQLCKI